MEFLSLIGMCVVLPILIVICVNLFVIVLSFLIGDGIFKLFNINPDSSIQLFIGQIVIASVICFIITYVLYLIYKSILKKERKFKQYFEGSYLLIVYISGLVSLLNALKPQLIESNLFKLTVFFSPDIGAGFALIFFISLSNYVIFKDLVIERKIFFIKDEKCKLNCKNYLEKCEKSKDDKQPSDSK